MQTCDIVAKCPIPCVSYGSFKLFKTTDWLSLLHHEHYHTVKFMIVYFTLLFKCDLIYLYFFINLSF